MPDPYIGFSDENLSKQPQAKKGDLIKCPHCQESHSLLGGMDVDTGEETDFLLFFTCGEQTYLAGVSGKLIVGLEPDASGEV